MGARAASRVAVRLLLVALLGLASCGAPAAPAATPPVTPNELLFLPRPDGGHSVLEVRDGSTVGELPAGALALRLSEGGDVSEAYVLGAAVSRVKIGRPVTVQTAAEPPLSPFVEAALVPAPGLTSFVGPKTVAIGRSADGSMAGYQAGRLIWRRGPGQVAALTQHDELAVARLGAGGWALVAPETGELTAVAPGCDQGVVAQLGGRPVMQCGGRLAVGGTSVGPAPGPDTPFAFHPVRGEELFLVWSGGGWVRLRPPATVVAHGSGNALSGRPALGPDGSTLYLPAAEGVVATGTDGRSRRVLKPAAADVVAPSRDGNFLYAIAAGRLDVRRADGGAIASYPVSSRSIDYVAGG